MKKEIIDAFQKGEDWAFNEIYARFLKPIRSYVGSRVSNDPIAQELTQEIFLKMFRFASSYQYGFAFTTWLWTIARNTVADFRRRPLLEQLPELQQARIPAEEAPAADPGADELMERKRLRRMIYRVSRALSPVQRRILWMRLVVQLPYQEIARRLDLTVAGARSLVHRAKLVLQQEGIPDELAELI